MPVARTWSTCAWYVPLPPAALVDRVATPFEEVVPLSVTDAPAGSTTMIETFAPPTTLPVLALTVTENESVVVPFLAVDLLAVIAATDIVDTTAVADAAGAWVGAFVGVTVAFRVAVLV